MPQVKGEGNLAPTVLRFLCLLVRNLRAAGRSRARKEAASCELSTHQSPPATWERAQALPGTGEHVRHKGLGYLFFKEGSYAAELAIAKHGIAMELGHPDADRPPAEGGLHSLQPRAGSGAGSCTRAAGCSRVTHKPDGPGTIFSMCLSVKSRAQTELPAGAPARSLRFLATAGLP